MFVVIGNVFFYFLPGKISHSQPLGVWDPLMVGVAQNPTSRVNMKHSVGVMQAELGCGNLKQGVSGLFGPADFVIMKHSLSVAGPFWHTSRKAKCAIYSTLFWTASIV